jgi:hypothetical protein
MSLSTSLLSSKARHKDQKEAIVPIGNSKFDGEIKRKKKYQAALEAICGPRVSRRGNHLEIAWLILEAKNRVHGEIWGRQVGYLGAETASQYCKQLKQEACPKADGQCQAVIKTV